MKNPALARMLVLAAKKVKSQQEKQEKQEKQERL
jgi:hypothetical protein